MRILHVAEAYGGGVFEIVTLLCNRMAEQGHEVLLLHGIRPETPTPLADHLHPAVRTIGEPWRDRSPRSLAAGTVLLRRTVAAKRPDVVHLHSSFAAFSGALVLPRDVVSVFTPHAYASVRESDPRLQRAAYRTLEAFSSRRASLVAGVSAHEARLAQSMGARATTVVANGIAALESPRPAAPRGRARVVAIGRTMAQRRPEACARILAALGPGIEVEWVGGGDRREGLGGLAALRAAGVAVSGWVDRDEVLRKLASANAYLHWTAWDGLALSLLEAMAVDTIAVASDIPPNREVLGAEQCCGTEAEAVALLGRIVTDPPFAERLLESQRRRRERFRADRMIRDALGAYEYARDLTGRGHENKVIFPGR